MSYQRIKPYLGSLEQIFSLRRSRIDGGRGDGVRVIDVHNGGNLSLTVLPDRIAWNQNPKAAVRNCLYWTIVSAYMFCLLCGLLIATVEPLGDYSVVITMTKLSGHISMYPFDKYSAFSGWLFRNT